MCLSRRFHDALEQGQFQSPIDVAELAVAANEIGSRVDDKAVKSGLRQLRNQQLVRILWRSISGVEMPPQVLTTPGHTCPDITNLWDLR